MFRARTRIGMDRPASHSMRVSSVRPNRLRSTRKNHGREITAIRERVGRRPAAWRRSYGWSDRRGIRREARPFQDRVLRELSFPNLPVYGAEKVLALWRARGRSWLQGLPCPPGIEQFPPGPMDAHV